MSEAEADARLRSQPPLDEKLKRADVVIDNGGSIEETRVQVLRAFVAHRPHVGHRQNAALAALAAYSNRRACEAPNVAALPRAEPVPALARRPSQRRSNWNVRRARPSDARGLAELLTRIEARAEPLGRAEMLERHGKYGYWLVRAEEHTVALAAWQAENLAAIVRELWVDKSSRCAARLSATARRDSRGSERVDVRSGCDARARTRRAARENCGGIRQAMKLTPSTICTNCGAV